VPGPVDYSSASSFVKPRLTPWTVRWYLHKKSIFDSIVKAKGDLTGKLLDVGCGNKPYKSVLNTDQYYGIDIQTSPHNHSEFDKVFDGLRIPFNDAEFDSVLCTEVLEHSERPFELMQEISRVLKNGGYALITAPMLIEHHEAPYDRQRFTYYGLRELAEKNNLKVQWIDPRGNFLSVWVYLSYLSLDQWLSRRPFIDIVYYLAFPFTWCFLKLDRFRKKKPAIMSMGWQMLVKK
jgi:SAM-dependent methyltransferase